MHQKPAFSFEGLDEQGQILLTNVYTNLSKLPKEILRQIISHFPTETEEVRPVAAQAAAVLLCVKGNTIRPLLLYTIALIIAILFASNICCIDSSQSKARRVELCAC